MRRSYVCQKYLRGDGIEIGAFSSPSLIPLGASVTYVDSVPASYWSKDSNYKGLKIVDPDIVTDGSTLEPIESSSLDFIISFHMLEHAPNTLRAVENWFRVLRPGGTLIVSVPDKRFTRDCVRELTPIPHFLSDYKNGSAWSAEEHYKEVGSKIENLSGHNLDQFIRDAPPAIHFHVWDMNSFLEFWLMARDYLKINFDIAEAFLNSSEDLIVLRKI
jgi:SAM-dependent methyltransferase